MGAPCANLRTLFTRLSKKIDKVALSNSALFIVPSLATTFASFILFYLLRGFDANELNTLAVILMSSVILSLVITACIQFVVYRVAGEASLSKEKATAKSSASRAVALGVLSSFVLSVVVSGLAYPYFKYALGFATAQFSFFAILLILYSIIWVLTAAFWASGQYKYPALVYAISYCAVFILSYLLYRLNPGYTIFGYIAGIAILFALLSLASWSVFRGGQKPEKLRLIEAALAFPKVISKDYWGMLFQTFYIIAIFLDKIVIWVSEGTKAGNGLQFVGPYTTGAFLGLVPTFSVVALAHFTEKIKPLSKDLYQGTLYEIRTRIEGYKRLYRRGLLAMLTIGLIFLIFVIGFSAYFIGDTKVLMVALTIATGVLFFEVILYDSFVLPIFGKSYISVISIMVVCFGEALAVPFVSNDICYASVGFLAGSFIGFLISHSQATRLLSEFDYNAFRAFQASS